MAGEPAEDPPALGERELRVVGRGRARLEGRPGLAEGRRPGARARRPGPGDGEQLPGCRRGRLHVFAEGTDRMGGPPDVEALVEYLRPTLDGAPLAKPTGPRISQCRESRAELTQDGSTDGEPGRPGPGAFTGVTPPRSQATPRLPDCLHCVPPGSAPGRWPLGGERAGVEGHMQATRVIGRRAGVRRGRLCSLRPTGHGGPHRARAIRCAERERPGHRLHARRRTATWAGLGGDRYERVGDDLRKVGAFATDAVAHPSLGLGDHRSPPGRAHVPALVSGRRRSGPSSPRTGSRSRRSWRSRSTSPPSSGSAATGSTSTPPARSRPASRWSRTAPRCSSSSRAGRWRDSSARRARPAPSRSYPGKQTLAPADRRPQRGVGEPGAARAALSRLQDWAARARLAGASRTWRWYRTAADSRMRPTSCA